jgi:hypothetical protein
MRMTLHELVSAWRNEAARLRGRYSAEELARLCEMHAQELETALAVSLDEQLTLDQAAERSGYSKSHLRRLMDDGTIRNVGEAGAPRVRLADLPFKTGRAPASRALSAEAARGKKRGGWTVSSR